MGQILILDRVSSGFSVSPLCILFLAEVGSWQREREPEVGPLENESVFGPAEPWKDRTGWGWECSLSPAFFFLYYLWIVDGRWGMAEGFSASFPFLGSSRKVWQLEIWKVVELPV